MGLSPWILLQRRVHTLQIQPDPTDGFTFWWRCICTANTKLYELDGYPIPPLRQDKEHPCGSVVCYIAECGVISRSVFILTIIWEHGSHQLSSRKQRLHPAFRRTGLSAFLINKEHFPWGSCHVPSCLTLPLGHSGTLPEPPPLVELLWRELVAQSSLWLFYFIFNYLFIAQRGKPPPTFPLMGNIRGDAANLRANWLTCQG